MQQQFFNNRIRDTKFYVDDILSFTFKNKEFNVKILELHGKTIIIQNIATGTKSSLTFHINKGFTVLNTNESALNLKVIQPATFPFDELSLYLKKEIILYLEHDDLINIAKTNKELYNLLTGRSSEDFWTNYGSLVDILYQQISVLHLHEKLIPFRAEENLSWRVFYHRIIKYKNSRLTSSADLNFAVANGNLLGVKFLNARYNIFMHPYHYNIDSLISMAIRNNHINILNWFYENKTLPTPDNIRSAIVNDCIEVCDWFEEKNLLPLTWKSYTVLSLKMMEWLIKRNYEPDKRDLFNAVDDNKLILARFLIDRKIVPDNTTMFLVIIKRYYDMLAYIYDNTEIYKNEKLIKYLFELACEHGRLEILKFFEKRGCVQMTEEILCKAMPKWNGDYVDILEYYDHLILDPYMVHVTIFLDDVVNKNTIAWMRNKFKR